MKRVILLLMIKNEERIIERCIRSALPYVDALCIVDTGSTDKTLEVVNQVLKPLVIPYDCSCDTWKNFGHNRSLSFGHAVEFCDILQWKRADTYVMLLDADMKWIVTDLQKDTLTAEGYTIQQRNGGLHYFNTRLLRLDIPWKSIGVTHEYWGGGKTDSLDPSRTYIEDVGDGGAKADKFTRDIRLLTEGLQEDPTNGRYMFYLAQSYKDTGRYQDAIQMYKKRIQAGGWHEEVWYAHYMIAKCYMSLKNELKMDYWANRAFEYRRERAEPLYILTKYYREKGDHWKAFYYCRKGLQVPLPKDVLFLENPVYTDLLEYEYTILHYYIYPKERSEGMLASLKYINNGGSLSGSVYSNSRFYMTRLTSTLQRLALADEGDYTPSSISCCPVGDRLLLNVRYVNYRIQSDGSYTTKIPHDNIRTRNAWAWKDALKPTFLQEESVGLPKREHRILGLEDVRLFPKEDGVGFLATSTEYSYNGKYRMVVGDYDYEGGVYRNCRVLRPPTETECEKNWIPLGDLFVYQWHPLKIGKVQDDQLVVTQEHSTPRWFQHCRGSSNAIRKDGFVWLIVHSVYPTSPRQYSHQVVALDEKTLSLETYSLPFYFDHGGIEYCLGWTLQGSTATAFVSAMDSSPFTCTFSLDSLVWV